MDLAHGMTALLPFHGGSHVPEMLGSFHLDDHNVEEWSDSTRPGMQHRGRKEIGKWTNADRKADIKYQKQEDNTRFHGGEEKQRQEVIEGKAPDSEFQIIRTQHEVQDKNDSNESRVSTTSTSYQMSSSNGVRSTTKTQSNKTTSKTVVVSGGGGVRHDEFEHLKLSYLPLDTSTQRERINVSRSGTMGVRRPPTRRHHQPPITSTVIENDDSNGALNSSASARLNSDISIKESSQQNDDSLPNEPQQEGVVGSKKISPKICVGFPAEIQMELQSKFRGPASVILANGSTRNSENSTNRFHRESSQLGKSKLNTVESEIVKESHGKRLRNSSGYERRAPLINASADQNESRLLTGTSFDFSQRRKSYGFEPFEDGTGVSAKSSDATYADPFVYSNNFINNSGAYSAKSISQQLMPPPVLSSSWDLIQNVSREKETNNNNNGLLHNKQRLGRLSSPAKEMQNIHSFSSYLSNRNQSLGESSNDEYSLKMKYNPFIEQEDQEEESHNHPENKAQNIITNQNIWNKLSDSVLARLGFSNLDERRGNDSYSSQKMLGNPDNTLMTEQSWQNRNSVHAKADQKLRMIEETSPDLLDQMSYRSYMRSPPPQYKSYPYSPFQLNDAVAKKSAWEGDLLVINDSEKDSDSRNRLSHQATTSNAVKNSCGIGSSMHTANLKNEHTPLGEDDSIEEEFDNSSGGGDDDDEFFTNDKKEFIVHRNPLILDLATNKIFQNQTKNEREYRSHLPDDHNINNSMGQAGVDNEFEENYNNHKKTTQVSQTWISAADIRETAALHYARDHDVTTSIYAINDPYRKPLKKVEFCKTEVHFTPEPGRFHIVESDENKPSTIHLYRRKKRGERKTAEFLRNALLESNNVEQIGEPTNRFPNLSSSGDNESQSQRSETTNNHKTGSSFASESLFSNRLRNSIIGQVQDEKDKDGTKFSTRHTSIANNEPALTSAARASMLGDTSSALFTHNSNSEALNQSYYKNDLHLNIGEFRSIKKDVYAPFEEEPDEDVLIVSSSHKRPFSPSKFKELLANENRSTDKRNLSTQLNNLNVGLNGSANILYNHNNEIDEDSNSSSLNHTITTQFGDLKIQKYLKQLKAPSSQEDIQSFDGDDFNRLQQEKILHGKHFMDLSERRNTTITDEICASDSNFRYDNAFYENGSFVPKATRQSLIEMNNRNCKQSRLRPPTILRSLAGTTISDNSSTMSNYSLPCSDHSHRGRSEYQPLKLTNMEATVATKGPTPQITSVELRYVLDNPNDLSKERNVKSHIYIPETPRSSALNRQSRFQQASNTGNKNNHRSFERIPSPVLPTSHFHSIQPDRSLHSARRTRSIYSLSPGQSPSLSPTPSQPKPPTPILPIHFSIAAAEDIRESPPFYRSRQKPSRESASDHDLRTVKSSSPERKGLSKSVVRIGDTVTEQGPIEFTTSTPHNGEVHVSAGTNQTANRDESEIYPKSGSSILRSLTFPKTARPEPEWVSKAKSREARMTDWSLVEKQHEGARQAEPPWIAELRVKNKNNLNADEENSAPRPSMVYPWNRPAILNENKDEANHKPLEKRKIEDKQEVAIKIPPRRPKESKAGNSVNSKLVTEHKTVNKLVPAASRTSSTRDRTRPEKNQDKSLFGIKTKTSSPTPSKSRISKTIISGQDGNASLSGRNSPASVKLIVDAKRIQVKDSRQAQAPTKAQKGANISSSSPAKMTQRQVKPSAPPRPPKPPQLNIPAITINGTKTKTGDPNQSKPNPNPKLKRRGNLSTSDVEISPGSTRSNTPIYLHPMVKISKLPLKTPKSSTVPDGKSSTRSRSKLSVSPMSESKRVNKISTGEQQLNGSKKGISAKTTSTSVGVVSRITPSPQIARKDADIINTKKKR